MSGYGNKGELIKRLESFEKNDNDDIRILQWQKRGRKPTCPSETVGYEEWEEDETSLKYKTDNREYLMLQ